MTGRKLLERIMLNLNIMAGKPIIRGTRLVPSIIGIKDLLCHRYDGLIRRALTLEYIVNLMVRDTTMAEIVDEYKGLMRKGIQVCLPFACKC